MGNPSRQKQRWRCLTKIEGVESQRIAEEIARVVERHQHHDCAAEDVDRFEARPNDF